jgi:hypothetical protein
MRTDFVAEDVVLVLLAHAGVIAGAGPIAPRLSARLLAYLLQAFTARSQDALPPAPSAREVYRALLQLHQPRAGQGPS